MGGSISEIVSNGSLPERLDALKEILLDPNGTYTKEEGQEWDFKASWPLSYSDEYFASLCRLVCAFANTTGGLIIFGVDDATRRGGKNSVTPNLDKFSNAFRDLTGHEPKLQLTAYSDPNLGDITILLVPPKPFNSLPVRFKRSLKPYEPGIFWVRQGYETVKAGPRHISTLYCRNPRNTVPHHADHQVSGSLPPSPATIKKFIGRLETINSIFDWIKSSDEPRAFLHGKGGSGKSTIAFQVAKVLKSEGASVKFNEEFPIENVIYISAKELELSTGDLERREFLQHDFSDEFQLYEAVVMLIGGQTELSTDIEGLKAQVVESFANQCAFLVIDDIDTLTTKGIEAGFDFLYRAVCKSKKLSKILYTLRNRPSQSISNAIEVPGLREGEEYNRFVEVCCDQFGVPLPPPDFRDNDLVRVSERRPLVIEAVVALRRTCGSYAEAAKLFEARSGDNVRQYVFGREWSSLSGVNRGREILAILAEYGQPMIFDEIVTVSQLESSKTRDALSDVQEMFLDVDHKGDETQYSIGDLTKSFVQDESRKLDFYDTIKTRVQKFKSTFYSKNPVLNKLLRRVERACSDAQWGKEEQLREVWLDLKAANYGPGLTEDPRFWALTGYVALKQQPPIMEEGREAFERAFSFKYAPDIDYVRTWFNAERQSDSGDVQTKRILELVEKERGYNDEQTIEFVSRRASFLYLLAREGISLEPLRSEERLIEAINLHAQAYAFQAKNLLIGLDRSIEYLRNTAFYLINELSKASRIEEFFSILKQISKRSNVAIDPLSEPISLLVRKSRNIAKTKSHRERIEGRIRALEKDIGRRSLWINEADREYTLTLVAAQAL